MSRIPLLLALAGLAAAQASAPVSVARRPNILLIITDDQGYGDLGAPAVIGMV